MAPPPPPPPPPSTSTPSNPELQPPIRRGRGRPRKYPRLEDQLLPKKEEEEEVKKEEEESSSKGGPPLSFPGSVPLKHEEEHGNGNTFFKIIHSHIIRNRKLAIPTNFVRKFSKDLSDFAMLKAPRGPTWRVELKKGHRGDVWFRKGWQDFVDYHSVSPTDFLIFRYNGNSQFHVLIFDVSGSEIDYLPSTTNHNIGGPFMTVKKEIIDEEEYMNTKNMAYVSPVINESSVKPKSNIINPVSKKKDEPKAEPKALPKVETKVEPKALDFSALMETASHFKSEHPFFIVQMKPSYVNHKFVPVSSTVDKSLMPGDRGWIKIRGSDGKEWSVGILASETKKEYRLSKGISAFLSDNDLKEGDVCAFELIKENEDDIMLKAHIFQ